MHIALKILHTSQVTKTGLGVRWADAVWVASDDIYTWKIAYSALSYEWIIVHLHYSTILWLTVKLDFSNR